MLVNITGKLLDTFYILQLKSEKMGEGEGGIRKDTTFEEFVEDAVEMELRLVEDCIEEIKNK